MSQQSGYAFPYPQWLILGRAASTGGATVTVSIAPEVSLDSIRQVLTPREQAASVSG